MEYLDDVALHAPCGKVILEQSKSALSGNPASDRSVDLWKALANWADLLKGGQIKSGNAEFRYYVTPVVSGKLIQQIASAKDPIAIQEILGKIEDPKFAGKPGVGAEPYISKFLNAPKPVREEVIRGFEFTTEENPLMEIRAKLVLLPPALIDNFCAAAIGIAKDRIEHLIREKKTPILSAATFKATFRAFVTKNNLSNYLVPADFQPNATDVSSLIQAGPVFVQQLSAVSATSELMITAVSDYLRCNADKTKWANEGTIFEDSLGEFDQSLLRIHTLLRDEIEDTKASDKPEQRGRALYRACSKANVKLEQRDLPEHFVAGAYNCLADLCAVGWHPNYKSIFQANNP